MRGPLPVRGPDPVTGAAQVTGAAAATGAAPTAGAASDPTCVADVPAAPLPGWARAGFSPPDQAVPYVLGVRGEIVGVLFGQPLSAGQRPGHGNKILWITRDDHPAGPLGIEATLAGSALTVSRQLTDGPGPSLVDLPDPGCWRLALTWPGHTDQVAVTYRGR